MKVDFVSEHLVGDEFANRLRADIASCSKLRFLIAYVSEAGLNTLGSNDIARALDQVGSFGVSSMSCICGFDPLLNLQNRLNTTGRLKYFLDPNVVKTPGDPTVVLLHSKLVYLQLPAEKKSVVYVGSHNWTERALSAGAPSNAEASVRIEMDFEPDHILGSGDSIAAQVNRHLLHASRLPACVEASDANHNLFEQWTQKGCSRDPTSKTEDAIIVLAVLKGTSSPTTARLNQLAQQGIYLRTDNSGQKLYEAGHRRVILMLWLSDQDLVNAEQPLLFRCSRTSDNPDPTSNVKSTNIAKSPSEGFGAAIFGGSDVQIWTGRTVQVFDFEFQPGSTTAVQVDQGKPNPQYRFHLDIEQIVFPAELPGDSELNETANKFGRWDRETFAVAENKKGFKYISIDGYLVNSELEESIANCFTEEFGVSKSQASVWPTSEIMDAMLGNFEATHPLHETFIRSDSFGSDIKVKPGEKTIVPKLDSVAKQKNLEESPTPKAKLESINQVTKAFVKQIIQLFDQWKTD